MSNGIHFQSYDGEIPRNLASISSQMTVETLKPTRSEVLQSSSSQQELNIMTLESGVLQQLEEGVQCWHRRSDQLRITLFERKGSQGRLLVQVDSRGCGDDSAEVGDLFGHNHRDIGNNRVD